VLGRLPIKPEIAAAVDSGNIELINPAEWLEEAGNIIAAL